MIYWLLTVNKSHKARKRAETPVMNSGEGHSDPLPIPFITTPTEKDSVMMMYTWLSESNNHYYLLWLNLTKQLSLANNVLKIKAKHTHQFLDGCRWMHQTECIHLQYACLIVADVKHIAFLHSTSWPNPPNPWYIEQGLFAILMVPDRSQKGSLAGGYGGPLAGATHNYSPWGML